MLALERKREQKWIDVSRPAAKRSADTADIKYNLESPSYPSKPLQCVIVCVCRNPRSVCKPVFIWSVHLCCYEICCPCLVLAEFSDLSLCSLLFHLLRTDERKWAFWLPFAFSLDLQKYFPPRSVCSVLLPACHFVVSSH